LNKKDAAAYLGVSERAIERYSAKGKLTVRYLQGRTRPVADFDEGELSALREEMQNPSEPTRPAIMPAGDSSPGSQALMVPNQEKALAGFVGMLLSQMSEQLPAVAARHSTSLSDKLMLSLPEAAEISGISVEQLRAAVKAKKLKTHPGIGGGYGKVKRADLDLFIKKL
jgi:hypothetical protein